MKRRYIKELWSVRFQKMHRIEKGMASRYSLLAQKANKLPKEEKVKHFIESSLKEIHDDEVKHAALVEELMDILKRQNG